MIKMNVKAIIKMGSASSNYPYPLKLISMKYDITENGEIIYCLQLEKIL